MCGMSLTAGLAAGALVLLAGPAPEYEYVPVRPSGPPAGPELVLNTAHCEKGAETFGDVAQAVAAAGSFQSDTVVSELRDAEVRMARRTEVPSERLTEIFVAAEATLRDLRLAIQDGAGIGAAVDATLDLMDTLEQQCKDVILSTGADGPG